MATTFYISPISVIVQYLTQLGLLAAGGQLYTYVGGTVNTPVTTYTDGTGSVPNPNPMTLSAAARPVSQSGAPVAFWAPAGTLIKLVVTDANANQLVYLDNLPLINDPSGPNSLQSLLANPIAGDGVDLVANALKSYAVVANVQATPSPTLASTQTQIIAVEGGAAVGDGLGGVFYWSATSNAVDDGGITTIQPSGSPATGRYLRLWGSSVGSFTATLTGMTAATTGTINYARFGNFLVLYAPAAITGVSNAASMQMTGLPAACQNNSANAQLANYITAGGEDNSVGTVFIVSWASASSLVFVRMSANTGTGVIGSSALTGSGTKGLNQGWALIATLV